MSSRQCIQRELPRVVTWVTPRDVAGQEALNSMHPDSGPAVATAELTLAEFDLRGAVRRAALPAAGVVAAAAALVVAGGPLRAFAHALDRALGADPRWVVAGAAFEIVSFAGYVLLLWAVAGRATRRIDARRAMEVTLGG